MRRPTFEAGSELALPCAMCHATTRSLKLFRIVDTFLFLGIAMVARARDVIACPRCMRRVLAKRLLVNLLTANVAWPLAVLPWNGLLLLRTLRTGHSRPLLDELVRIGVRRRSAVPVREQAPTRRPCEATTIH